jgi:hypothetical protein
LPAAGCGFRLKPGGLPEGKTEVSRHHDILYIERERMLQPEEAVLDILLTFMYF